MTKYRLLAGTAIVAGSALAGSQAMAFDEVSWSWDLDVDTDVTQTITTTTELVPTGLVAVEDIQIFIGDLSASSTVTGVTNEQPATEGDTIEVPLTLILEGEASATGETTLTSSAHARVEDADNNVLAETNDDINNTGIDPSGTFDGEAGFVVEVEIPGEGQAFDAITDLPEVVSAAAAIANNITINTEVKTDLHETQILFDADDDSSGSYTVETTSNSTTTTTTSASESSSSNSTSTAESFEDAAEFFIGGTLAYDKTLDKSASVDLDESLSADFDKSVSASGFADVDFFGDFSASASGSGSASASLDQAVDVKDTVDFDVSLDGSKSYDWFANATGTFDGSATVDAEANANASGSLDITKDVDVDYTKTAALDLDVSGFYEASSASSFSSTSESASSSSSSFSTETTTTSTLDTKSVTTDGDLYALDTAFALWGDLLDQGVNTGLATTLSLMVAAAYGGLEKSEVTADSFVDDITNASVDSSALAIGNNKNVTLEAATPNDAMLIADVSQFAYADVEATSSVSNVTVSNYLNLGVIPVPGSDNYRPLVDSTATAIGNNLSITVTSPLSANEE